MTPAELEAIRARAKAQVRAEILEDDILALLDEIERLTKALENFRYGAPEYRPDWAMDTAIVAHHEGKTDTFHRLDEPCALCRPPIKVTEAMVMRARSDGRINDCGNPECDGCKLEMRDALEAAFNGAAK